MRGEHERVYYVYKNSLYNFKRILLSFLFENNFQIYDCRIVEHRYGIIEWSVKICIVI